MKFVMMNVSEKFDNKSITFYGQAKQLANLHLTHNTLFSLPKTIKKSEDPARMLNAFLMNEAIFSFSFVRHPYTR